MPQSLARRDEDMLDIACCLEDMKIPLQDLLDNRYTGVDSVL
jgi:hypothetical protein